MAKRQTKTVKLTAADGGETYQNPLYGGTRFNPTCILEYTVDMEQKTVLIRVTDEINGKTYGGSADLQEVE